MIPEQLNQGPPSGEPCLDQLGLEFGDTSFQDAMRQGPPAAVDLVMRGAGAVDFLTRAEEAVVATSDVQPSDVAFTAGVAWAVELLIARGDGKPWSEALPPLRPANLGA